MTTVENLVEEACNKFVEDGGMPKVARLHPDTMQRLRDEFKPRLRISMPAGSVIINAFATQAATVELIEDDTVPVDLVVVE
jgi:hypothetical protein